MWRSEIEIQAGPDTLVVDTRLRPGQFQRPRHSRAFVEALLGFLGFPEQGLQSGAGAECRGYEIDNFYNTERRPITCCSRRNEVRSVRSVSAMFAASRVLS
ncbi:hypothetical protein C5E45_34970 [Nocardia nova]|uniref:Uncharacterized protein n=2 Tax=Nocardia nova TaxID=37330 RepID=A0A2S6A3A5_9NOCA|nr:hypothetical protein C5E41_32755 [Nocardia nova]PPJ26348.1 hypothetical protein C5E45_34970 [Nocardia nova]